MIRSALFVISVILISPSVFADPFEDSLPECFKVSRVHDSKIFVLNNESKEEELVISESNSRRGLIVQKAKEAKTSNKLLCGSVRGISTKDLEPPSSQDLSGEKLQNFCEDKKEEFKKSKGWTGLLRPSQSVEVEDFYTKCLVTKGKSEGSTQLSREDKVNRYHDCRESAIKAEAECYSSIDPKICIEGHMSRQKQLFQIESDFLVMPHGSSNRQVVQCRIDGRAPSRQELGAPTRTAPTVQEDQPTGSVR